MVQAIVGRQMLAGSRVESFLVKMESWNQLKLLTWHLSCDLSVYPFVNILWNESIHLSFHMSLRVILTVHIRSPLAAQQGRIPPYLYSHSGRENACEKTSYVFLRKELPVRLANTMREVNLLPDKLLSQPSVRLVQKWWDTRREVCIAACVKAAFWLVAWRRPGTCRALWSCWIMRTEIQRMLTLWMSKLLLIIKS